MHVDEQRRRRMVLAQVRVDPGATEVRFTVDPEELKQRFATVRARIVDRSRATPTRGGTPPASVALEGASTGLVCLPAGRYVP